MTLNLVGPLVASVLTLLILSYLIGDNPLYRLAVHFFIGILVGYSLGVVVKEVLLGMALPELSSSAMMVVPLLLGVLLFLKGIPRLSFVGNVSIAYLVGVGTAAALGGVMLGSMGPQLVATGQALDPASLESFRFGLLDGLMIVVGTVCTLLAFTYSASKTPGRPVLWRRIIIAGPARIGHVFLVFAFALAFAGALTASLSIFVARMDHTIRAVMQALGL